MKQILCVLIPLAVITVLMPLLVRRMKREKMMYIAKTMFVIYVACNLYCTVFSRGSTIESEVVLQPLGSYLRLFDSVPTGGRRVTGVFGVFMNGTLPITGIILNILLYYPLGYLLPILFPKLKPKHVILIGCLCSIATEAVQYLLKMGWCETDDVIHNTLGTAIGVWVWHLQSKRLNKPKSNELAKD
ncbi:MAG: VanZ family protein [Clostridiales bacterium]|nr:VanZ family protein [Clostridiales bacterium]MBE5810093.1 VanZ family protein [Clostridiales bacterium]